jgi:DNA-binding transcriptional ArsR family regulator
MLLDMPTSFELLADPTRRRLLDELRQGERSVGSLVESLKMSQPAVSKQLRVLREAGLASVRVDAQRRIYRLNPEGLREVDEWLAPYRAFWERRLDAMERTLENLED